MAYNVVMEREEKQTEEKRISLRLRSIDLWRQLRMEAARRDVSTTEVINLLLEERLDELDRSRG
jgi:hypothetical protein